MRRISVSTLAGSTPSAAMRVRTMGSASASPRLSDKPSAMVALFGRLQEGPRLRLGGIECFPGAQRVLGARRQVVMDDLAKPQREVAQEVHRGEDFQDRQLRHWRHSMGAERQRTRSGPRALDRDVLEVIFDKFAN